MTKYKPNQALHLLFGTILLWWIDRFNDIREKTTESQRTAILNIVC